MRNTTDRPESAAGVPGRRLADRRGLTVRGEWYPVEMVDGGECLHGRAAQPARLMDRAAQRHNGRERVLVGDGEQRADLGLMTYQHGGEHAAQPVLPGGQ